MFVGFCLCYQLYSLTCRLAHILTDFVALLVVNNNTNFAWLVFHVIPAQAITIQTFSFVLAHPTLRLTIDKEFTLDTIGITVDRRHLTFAIGPCPMRQQVNGMFLCVPTALIKIVAILRQSCQVADAKIAATRRPVFIIGRRLAQIVITRPDKFTNHPVVVILPHPIIVRQVRPRAVFYIVTRTLTIGFQNGCRVVGRRPRGIL